MSVHKRTAKSPSGKTTIAWQVKWREGDRQRSRTFAARRDAVAFDADITRRRRLGTLAELDRGTQNLDEFVTETWAVTYLPMVSEKTRRGYVSSYDCHIAPQLGSVQLRQLSPELIARWQSDRLAAGAGPVAVAKSLTLLGNICQRAFEGQHITTNPVRAVRRARLPRKTEVRPLAPTTIERMRSAASPRDATLLSVLGYAGLRPAEALALRWGDVRDKTILIERALSLGEEKDTKTTTHRSVRLLAPLAADLKAWRMRSGRPGDDELIFPGEDDKPWTEPAYQSWRRRSFRKALMAALDKTAASAESWRERRCPKCKAAVGAPCRTPSGQEAKATHADRLVPASLGVPYDLRHSFASLLLHEGRSVIYVARQLGHDARLTLTTYGHVIDELEDAPRQDAETTIQAAREAACSPHVPKTAAVPSAGPGHGA